MTRNAGFYLPFSGETERALGVTAEHAAETALLQAKPIEDYLNQLVNTGYYPALEDRETRVRVVKELRNSLAHTTWPHWVFLYYDGEEIIRGFADARQILDVLRADTRHAIKSVLSYAHYLAMLEQAEDAAWWARSDEARARALEKVKQARRDRERQAREDSSSPDEYDDDAIPFDD